MPGDPTAQGKARPHGQDFALLYSSNEPHSVRIFLDSYGDTPVCEAAATESLITLCSAESGRLNNSLGMQPGALPFPRTELSLR